VGHYSLTIVVVTGDTEPDAWSEGRGQTCSHYDPTTLKVRFHVLKIIRLMSKNKQSNVS